MDRTTATTATTTSTSGRYTSELCYSCNECVRLCIITRFYLFDTRDERTNSIQFNTVDWSSLKTLVLCDDSMYSVRSALDSRCKETRTPQTCHIFNIYSHIVNFSDRQCQFRVMMIRMIYSNGECVFVLRQINSVRSCASINKKQMNDPSTHFHRIFQKHPKLLPFGTSPAYDTVILLDDLFN